MSHAHGGFSLKDKTMRVIMVIILVIAVIAVGVSIIGAPAPTMKEVLFARIKNQQEGRSTEFDPEHHALVTKFNLTQEWVAKVEAANETCRQVDVRQKEKIANLEKEIAVSQLTGETQKTEIERLGLLLKWANDENTRLGGRNQELQQRLTDQVTTMETKLASIKAELAKPFDHKKCTPDNCSEVQFWKVRSDKFAGDNDRLRKELDSRK